MAPLWHLYGTFIVCVCIVWAPFDRELLPEGGIFHGEVES
jgi:hypothetical protein